MTTTALVNLMRETADFRTVPILYCLGEQKVITSSDFAQSETICDWRFVNCDLLLPLRLIDN